MFGVECRHRMNVVVDTYDTKLELTIFPKTKGKELYERVLEALDVPAGDATYLAIACTRFDGTQAWLEDDKEIYQQRFQRSDPVVFYFKFKFFPEDVAAVEGETSLKILYLQAREAVLSGRVFCPKAMAVELASYAAQIKFGNFDSLVGTDYLKKDRWVPPNVIKDSRDRVGARQVRESIASLHRTHYGKTIAESMRHYVQGAQTLSTFGMAEFQVSVRVGDEKQKCCVGVSPRDVRLYEAASSSVVAPMKTFLWKDVSSCSINASRVKMRLRGHLTDPDFEIVSKQANALYELCLGYLHLHNKNHKAASKADGSQQSGGGRQLEDRKLEDALAQEVEARERAQQETERLRERHGLLVDKLRESERENETLRQKVHFLQERIHLWKSQLMHTTDVCNEGKPSGDDSNRNTVSQNPNTCRLPGSPSRLPKPTPARRESLHSAPPSAEDVRVPQFKSRLPMLKSGN